MAEIRRLRIGVKNPQRAAAVMEWSIERWIKAGIRAGRRSLCCSGGWYRPFLTRILIPAAAILLVGFATVSCREISMEPHVVTEAMTGSGDRSWWHQQYEPLLDARVHDHAERFFGEATRRYGPAAQPVREVYVYRGTARHEPSQIGPADVLDWQALRGLLAHPPAELVDLLAKVEVPAASFAFESDAPLPPVADRLSLTQAVNRVIASRDVEAVVRARLAAAVPDVIAPHRGVVPRLREGIEQCEWVDPHRGVFVIYLSLNADRPDFLASLGHECLHLLNPRLRDWYVEGLASVFAEQAAEAAGGSFEPWRRRFARDRHVDPYAVSYFMMKRVVAAAGADMSTFLRHTRSSDHSRDQRIDIDAWLATLSIDRRQAVIECIANHAGRLASLELGEGAFVRPACLRRGESVR